MSEWTTLDYRVEDGIAVATFNRPGEMNTFNRAMRRDLIALFDRTDADDAVRAVVLTGSGRAFCAGADLGAGADTFNVAARDAEDDIIVDGVQRDGGGRVALRIFDSLKPVIAAVNGAAVGIGATLQLPMDARLASDAARFGFVFARRGITPEACSSWFLPRLVGIPTALDWLYSGRIVGAQEALAAGLIQAVHEPDALLPAAIAHARALTDHSAPVSVALSRQMVWRMLGQSDPMIAHRTDSRALQLRGRSADAREGINAFLAKRSAAFPDRVSAGLPDLAWPERPEFR